MARMVPSAIHGDTLSAAERKLFGKIRDELSNDWTVLHSLGLTTHDRKPWAEIDFVVVGTGGVFCLEVKGGRITRSGGVWTTTDREGRVSTLKESPFAQVGSASAGLRRYMLTQSPFFRDTLVGHGVLFPDIKFNGSGPDIDQGIVFDERDLNAPFRDYLERIVEYWQSRLNGRVNEGLDQNKAQSLLRVLRGDFDLRPSLRTQARWAQEELDRFTQGQVKAFAGLMDNKRVLVKGGAGTGKTFLAVEHAKRLAGQGMRVLYTCFNKRLADLIGANLQGVANVRVAHLHGLMADIVTRAGMSSRLNARDQPHLFEVLYPELCVEACLAGEGVQFDAVVIDEGQDLLLNAYVDVLDVISVHGLRAGMWSMFLDHNQDIFGRSGNSGINRLLEGAPTRYHLSVNCRNTAPVAAATAIISGAPLDEVMYEEGPAVLQEWCGAPADERRTVSKIIGNWLHQGIAPGEIVVLSPRRLEQSCLASGLIGVSVSLIPFDRGSSDSRGIRFSTIHSFKGLEATAVALVDVDEFESPYGASVIYVGASRARVVLAILLKHGQEEAYDKRAAQFGQRLTGAANLR